MLRASKVFWVYMYPCPSLIHTEAVKGSDRVESEDEASSDLEPEPITTTTDMDEDEDHVDDDDALPVVMQDTEVC